MVKICRDQSKKYVHKASCNCCNMSQILQKFVGNSQPVVLETESKLFLTQSRLNPQARQTIAKGPQFLGAPLFLNVSENVFQITISGPQNEKEYHYYCFQSKKNFNFQGNRIASKKIYVLSRAPNSLKMALILLQVTFIL